MFATMTVCCSRRTSNNGALLSPSAPEILPAETQGATLEGYSRRVQIRMVRPQIWAVRYRTCVFAWKPSRRPTGERLEDALCLRHLVHCAVNDDEDLVRGFRVVPSGPMLFRFPN